MYQDTVEYKLINFNLRTFVTFRWVIISSKKQVFSFQSIWQVSFFNEVLTILIIFCHATKSVNQKNYLHFNIPNTIYLYLCYNKLKVLWLHYNVLSKYFDIWKIKHVAKYCHLFLAFRNVILKTNKCIIFLTYLIPCLTLLNRFATFLLHLN